MYFGRKFSRSKWDVHSKNNKKIGFDEKAIPADAISADLRTQNNTLSFWKCDRFNSEDENAINAVFLALVSTFERIDKIDVVFIEKNFFENDGQDIQQTEGNTPVVSLRDLHVDIAHLDYERLGHVAERIRVAIESGQVKSLSKPKVKALILKAIDDKALQCDELNEKLREVIIKIRNK